MRTRRQSRSRCGAVRTALAAGLVWGAVACAGPSTDAPVPEAPASRAPAPEVPATAPGGAPAPPASSTGSDEPEPEPEPTAAEASLVVTYQGFDAGTHQVEVSAFVAGAVESGGSCELAVSQGGERLTATTEAAAAARTTDCGLLQLQLPGGASGRWELEVTYTSTATQVSTQGAPMEVL